MKYLLDTSALLALFQDEAGADTVANLFGTRELDGTELLISFISIFELVYLATLRHGHAEAVRLVHRVRTLQLNEVWPTEEQLWLAGSIKSQGGLSGADAFVASAAVVNSATLVHRDPEFRQLSTKVPQLDLMLPQADV
jgi:predicted nucleic acid-binding protein